MAEGVIGNLAAGFSSLFDGGVALNVLVLILLLVVVSLFIWKFYNSTSRRNLIRLDLKKYNQSDHPIMSKFLAIVFYLLEYIIVIPFLLLLWFAGLAIVLLLIGKDSPVNELLLIAALVIGAIRVLAYLKDEISKDLAKMFPFMALSLFLLTPHDFTSSTFASELFVRVQEIPNLLVNIFSFIVVVFVIEIVLRVLYTIYEFWKSEEEDVVEKIREGVAEE